MKNPMTMQATKTPREPTMILSPFDDIVDVVDVVDAVGDVDVVGVDTIALVVLDVVFLVVVVVAFPGAIYRRAIPIIGASVPSEFSIGAYSEVL
jgi:hypothetical protein